MIRRKLGAAKVIFSDARQWRAPPPTSRPVRMIKERTIAPRPHQLRRLRMIKRGTFLLATTIIVSWLNLLVSQTMAFTHEDVQGTLSLIETMRLPHPSGRLLSSFVTEAVDPALAACYVRDRLSAGDAYSMVSDWTYIIESRMSSSLKPLYPSKRFEFQKNGLPLPPPDAITQRAILKRDEGKCCVTGKAGTFWDPLQVMAILPVPSGWITDKVGSPVLQRTTLPTC